jgi:hypothetical protein
MRVTHLVTSLWGKALLAENHDSWTSQGNRPCLFLTSARPSPRKRIAKKRRLVPEPHVGGSYGWEMRQRAETKKPRINQGFDTLGCSNNCRCPKMATAMTPTGFEHPPKATGKPGVSDSRPPIGPPIPDEVMLVWRDLSTSDRVVWIEMGRAMRRNSDIAKHTQNTQNVSDDVG